MDFFHSLSRLELELRLEFVIIFFGILFITDHVLLLSLVDTADTILAGDAVFEEITIVTTLAVLRIFKIVAVGAVDTLVTKFTLVADRAVGDGFAFFE